MTPKHSWGARVVFLLLVSGSALFSRSADWPSLHGNLEHTGRSKEQLQFPLTLQWADETERERISTAAEPVVTNGVIGVTTQIGYIKSFNTNGDSIARVAAKEKR